MKDDDDFTDLFKTLPKDLQDELVKAVQESGATSAEGFLSEIFVGPCPECGSSNTRDCEDVPDINDLSTGLCKECGHIWCLDCGRTVTKGSVCEHYDICGRCRKKKDEFGDCALLPWQCKKISTFRMVLLKVGQAYPDRHQLRSPHVANLFFAGDTAKARGCSGNIAFNSALEVSGLILSSL